MGIGGYVLSSLMALLMAPFKLSFCCSRSLNGRPVSRSNASSLRSSKSSSWSFIIWWISEVSSPMTLSSSLSIGMDPGRNLIVARRWMSDFNCSFDSWRTERRSETNWKDIFV